jgi:hypothetical protein
MRYIDYNKRKRARHFDLKSDTFPEYGAKIM